MNTGKEKSTRDGHAKEETTAIRVECYAGHRAEESPRRFFLGNREIRVNEIIDRWLDPDYSYFKVHADDGDIYILRYDRTADTWQMTLFSSVTHNDTCLSST
ncbi:MAG: hypothetical protein WBP44_12945 [Gammaproteobacteria bacterium]|jgi:hypothetical protein